MAYVAGGYKLNGVSPLATYRKMISDVVDSQINRTICYAAHSRLENNTIIEWGRCSNETKGFVNGAFFVDEEAPALREYLRGFLKNQPNQRRRKLN